MNYIIEYHNVLSSDICENIITKFEQSKLTPGQTVGGFLPDIKITYDYCINCTDPQWCDESDILCKSLLKSVKQYMKTVQTYVDSSGNSIYLGTTEMFLSDDNKFNMQVYRKNIGKYVYHHDFKIDLKRHLYRYRMLAFIFYLNNVDEGGETEFFGYHKIKPETGKLVIFPACWTFPHMGKMPISSDKYIITGWLYKDIFLEKIIDKNGVDDEESTLEYKYF